MWVVLLQEVNSFAEVYHLDVRDVRLDPKGFATAARLGAPGIAQRSTFGIGECFKYRS